MDISSVGAGAQRYLGIDDARGLAIRAGQARPKSDDEQKESNSLDSLGIEGSADELERGGKKIAVA